MIAGLAWSPRGRRLLHVTLVAAITFTALSFSLPNLLESTNATGDFDFGTNANVVTYAGPQAEAAGIAAGDRIDYFLMPPNQRYGDVGDGLREPPVGETVPFIVEHRGKTHVARLTAHAEVWTAAWPVTNYLLRLTTQKAIFFVLVLLAMGLVLMRPSPVTAAFFLFVAGNGVVPLMYAFLPAWGYAGVMAADDALAGIGAIGFLALALYLNPKPVLRALPFTGLMLGLLTIIVAPIAASDVSELIAGTRPAWPVAGWASFVTLWLCFITGIVLLLRIGLNSRARRSLRVLAVLLATVGALTIFDWTLSASLSTWYFHNLPGVAMNRGVFGGTVPMFPTWLYRLWFYNDTFFIVRQLGELIALYVIIRAGIADAGPIYRRIIAYVIAAPLIAAIVAFANVAVMPHFTHYGILVALEIVGAIAFGYWVSGLRDVAGCLSLASTEAWSAWASGRSSDERDALAQALGLAQRSRRHGIIAEVRAQIAFSSWRNGEDGVFEQKVDALQRVLRGRNLRGIGAFADAATVTVGGIQFDERDLPEWRARAALVLCTRTGDSVRARQLAREALANADRAGLASLQVLSAIAVAESCPEQRAASLEQAHAIARDAGWPTLSKSILALRANARDIGILQTFVDVRLRKTRPACPAFHVSFFEAQLSVGNTRVPLSAKQLELLLTVAASRTGIKDSTLIDALWPESEGDAARNSLRVCLHGLRKSAGDGRIITRVGKGFVLHPWADVDLWKLESALSAYRESATRENAREVDTLCAALRAGNGRRATLGEWFFHFDSLLNRKLEEAERILTRAPVRSARS